MAETQHLNRMLLEAFRVLDGQVEGRGRAEAVSKCRLVSVGVAVRPVDRVDAGAHVGEERRSRHAQVRTFVILGDAPFVAEEELGLLPRVRRAGQPPVERFGRVATGEDDGPGLGLEEQITRRGGHILHNA